MSESTVFTREATEEDLEQAKTLAIGFATSMPGGTKSHIILAATSLFVPTVFNKGVKAQYRLAAFEDFAAHVRKQIEKDL